MNKFKGNFEDSNFYHVLTRGIAKQIIFEDAKDSKYFLKLLEKYSEKYEISIICYCLMINHVHIICQDSNKKVASMMADICSTYAKYFNRKYERIGSLFQRPYKKKLITTDSYLLTAFRYVIKNPEKDMICKYQKYEWSSYKFIFDEAHFTDATLIVDMIGEQQLENFLSQNEYSDNMLYDLELEPDKKSSVLVLEKFKNKYHIRSATSIRSFAKEKRNEAILYLHDSGLSIRQIERFTGISRGITQRVLYR